MAHNGGIEPRVKPVPLDDLPDRVARLETRMEYLATRQDLERVFTSLEKYKNETIKWIIGTGVSILGLVLAYIRWFSV